MRVSKNNILAQNRQCTHEYVLNIRPIYETRILFFETEKDNTALQYKSGDIVYKENENNKEYI